MITKELLDINRTLLDKYDTHAFKDAVHCVMPGYFSGNLILFVAQNPGELKPDVEGDMLYQNAFRDKQFDKLNGYYVQALRSTRGTYGTFINDLYGTDWTDISLTNVFKCPFVGNKIPSYTPAYERIILGSQIRELKPKLVVAVGKCAKEALSSLILDCPVIYTFHPSYLKRSNIYEKMVSIYREKLRKKLLTPYEQETVY